ncbi:MAG: hypothetical protein KBT09_07015, partial [Bacteroidales bacterium]|nr:hypothetical protein [Candidatus Sodaliphilus fimicaballi]
MNNRIKSRYLRVMLLSLLFLLTAGQLSAKMIYFENNINWSTVKVHMWGDANGDVKLTSTGDGKWFSGEIPDNAKDLLFYNGSWGGNNQTGNLSYPTDGNNAFVWNGEGEGYWKTYNPTPVEATWTVVGNKAILNGSTDWDTNNTANDMVKGANGTYTLTVEKTNLAAGNYEYKVVKNHSYSDGEFPSGQNNNTLTISEAGDYTIVYTYDGASNLTATATKNAPVVDPKTGKLYIKVADGAYTAMTENADGNFTWTGDINNDVVIKFRSKDNDDDNYHLHPSGSGDYWVNETNHSDNPAFGAGYNYLMKWGNGNYTITVPADYSSVSFTKNAGYIENGIPVYPIGVQSETELKKYDFVNNPAIYLQCKVLNAERVSPEWQMIKGDDGKYHLNGFAMRGTKCRDWNGKIDIEALAFVRIYDANGTHTAGSFKLDKSAYLTNGELYNATFDPETNTLSLTEDETAQGHMPFISLVGNEMKQDQNYTTPRNSHTDSAWQEAWIQYDENGNILKDREGNVMYSTMWPPKNPIYFTANIGGERLYSSEQMTFKVDNNFTAKTGAEWKEQLTGDEYTDLALDD